MRPHTLIPLLCLTLLGGCSQDDCLPVPASDATPPEARLTVTFTDWATGRQDSVVLSTPCETAPTIEADVSGEVTVVYEGADDDGMKRLKLGLSVYQIIILIVATVALIALSWRSLRQPHHHGFYRFFAWEAILIQLTINLPYWFVQPLSWHQWISWLFLGTSIYLATTGFYLLHKMGGSRSRTGDDPNYAFENTGALVTQSVFAYIRHPLYCSLLCLVWGAFFKFPSLPGVLISLVASAGLYATAKVEERENIRTFGPQYVAYMKTSKMFIPFVL